MRYSEKVINVFRYFMKLLETVSALSLSLTYMYQHIEHQHLRCVHNCVRNTQHEDSIPGGSLSLRNSHRPGQCRPRLVRRPPTQTLLLRRDTPRLCTQPQRR